MLKNNINFNEQFSNYRVVDNIFKLFTPIEFCDVERVSLNNNILMVDNKKRLFL